MTRRERLESRMARREEWAEKAHARSSASYQTSHNLVAGIPMGQPVLVGHHSEGRHRRTLERSDNAMRRSVNEQHLVEHHESKAAGISAQLEHTIFSDDDNAIEALEQRIAENEAKRNRMKKVNALYRKTDIEGLKALGVDYDELKARLEELGAWFGKAPHMPFELSNLGQRIKADKMRVEQIKRDSAKREAAAAAKSGVVVQGTGDYVSVTFAEKPDRTVLNDLRGAGFFWRSPSWSGRRDFIPQSVKELAALD